MTKIQICPFTGTACAWDCSADLCVLSKQIQVNERFIATPAPRPMGCICPGDATPFCQNQYCSRKRQPDKDSTIGSRNTSR